MTTESQQGDGAEKHFSKVILNACLSFIRHLMSSKDKLFIREATTRRFDFDALKNAYKIVFEVANPELKCGFRGKVKNAGIVERLNDAFEKIFDLLSKFDQEGTMPIFAYPFDEPLSVLAANGGRNSLDHDKRIEDLELGFAKMQDTLLTYAGVAGHQDDVFHPTHPIASTSRLTAPSAAPMSAVSPTVRGRLESRGRLDSRSSSKRRRSDGDDEYNTCDDSDSEFVLPNSQRKKLARREGHSYAAAASGKPRQVMSTQGQSSHSVRRQTNNTRKEGVWGKKKANHASNFGGVGLFVPKVFIERCKNTTEAEYVKHFLMEENIGIINVELASHPDSKFRSFIVTVKTREDFDKLLSGEHIPEHIMIRQFYPPRGPPRPQYQSNSNMMQAQQQRSRDVADMEALPTTLAVRSPSSPQVSIPQTTQNSDEQLNVVLTAAAGLMTSSQMTNDVEVN